MTENPLSATNLLKSNWLPEYQKQRDAIFRQLGELKTMMFILEKIEMFPFWLFTPNTHDYVFWRTIKNSLVESILMIVSRVIVETGNNALTLGNFKHEMLENVVNPQAKQQIIEHTKLANFDKRIKETKEKVRLIRNNFLAHLDKAQQTTLSDDQIDDVTYGEIKEMVDASFDLFNSLSFDSYYVPWLHEYRDQIRNENQTDIDRLLDHVAQSSQLLNLPEREPEVWRRKRVKLSEEEIKLINYYRTRANLPEIE